MGLFLLLSFAAVLVIAIAALATSWHLRHPPRKTLGVALARRMPTDPGQIGRRFDDLTLRLPAGHDTPGWRVPGDAPDAPAVLVVHGFGDSRFGALTWTPLLLPHASEVVLFDLPGHGECPAPVSHLGAREHRDVVHLLDQVDAGRGVVLFGYSMGGGIAVAAAATGDPRIVGVVADGPYARWHEPVRRVLRARRYPTWPVLPLTGLLLRLLSPGWRPYDRVAEAGRLPCPLLVLHGSGDPLCAFDEARAMADAAPHGRLVAFPDGLHLDLAHCDEPRYHDALRDFFKRLPNRKLQATDEGE